MVYPFIPERVCNPRVTVPHRGNACWLEKTFPRCTLPWEVANNASIGLDIAHIHLDLGDVSLQRTALVPLVLSCCDMRACTSYGGRLVSRQCCCDVGIDSILTRVIDVSMERGLVMLAPVVTHRIVHDRNPSPSPASAGVELTLITGKGNGNSSYCPLDMRNHRPGLHAVEIADRQACL